MTEVQHTGFRILGAAATIATAFVLAVCVWGSVSAYQSPQTNDWQAPGHEQERPDRVHPLLRGRGGSAYALAGKRYSNSAARVPEQEHFPFQPVNRPRTGGTGEPVIVGISLLTSPRRAGGAGFSPQTNREATPRGPEWIRSAARNHALQWSVGTAILVLLAVLITRLWVKKNVERPIQEALEQMVELAGKIETSFRILKGRVQHLEEQLNPFRKAYETNLETAKTVSRRAHLVTEGIRRHRSRMEEGVSLAKSLIQQAKEAEAGLVNSGEELSSTAEFLERLSTLPGGQDSVPQDDRNAIDRTAKRLAAAWKTVHTASKRAASLPDTPALLHACATEMGEVAETVAALSRETRLLALNAAIHAAHSSEGEDPLMEMADRSQQLAGRMDQGAEELRKKMVRTRYHAIQSAKAIETMVQIVAEIDFAMGDSLSGLRKQISRFHTSWEKINHTVETARTACRRIRDTEDGVRNTAENIRKTIRMGMETTDTLLRITETWKTLVDEAERLAATAFRSVPPPTGADREMDPLFASLRETDQAADALAAAADTLRKTLERFTR